MIWLPKWTRLFCLRRFRQTGNERGETRQKAKHRRHFRRPWNRKKSTYTSSLHRRHHIPTIQIPFVLAFTDSPIDVKILYKVLHSKLAEQQHLKYTTYPWSVENSNKCCYFEYKEKQKITGAIHSGSTWRNKKLFTSHSVIKQELDSLRSYNYRHS